MVYYSKKNYDLIGFLKSQRANKKYTAVIQNKKTQKFKFIDFGQLPYENYRDMTGLNLYPELIHGDTFRRHLYKQRHRQFYNKDSYSPEYFSWNYLW
jgi:hypothetical protein